jgi:dihydroneopterin aldolase
MRKDGITEGSEEEQGAAGTPKKGRWMDMLFLEGLEVPCRVGCTDPERATPQSLRAEVRLYVPSLRAAGVADDLEQTVDYRLAGDLIDAVQGREFLLIERVAEVMAEVVLKNPLVERVTVSVKKRPPVQGLEWAGVEITRERGA